MSSVAGVQDGRVLVVVRQLGWERGFAAEKAENERLPGETGGRP